MQDFCALEQIDFSHAPIYLLTNNSTPATQEAIEDIRKRHSKEIEKTGNGNENTKLVQTQLVFHPKATQKDSESLGEQEETQHETLNNAEENDKQPQTTADNPLNEPKAVPHCRQHIAPEITSAQAAEQANEDKPKPKFLSPLFGELVVPQTTEKNSGYSVSALKQVLASTKETVPKPGHFVTNPLDANFRENAVVAAERQRMPLTHLLLVLEVFCVENKQLPTDPIVISDDEEEYGLLEAEEEARLDEYEERQRLESNRHRPMTRHLIRRVRRTRHRLLHHPRVVRHRPIERNATHHDHRTAMNPLSSSSYTDKENAEDVIKEQTKIPVSQSSSREADHRYINSMFELVMTAYPQSLKEIFEAYINSILPQGYISFKQRLIEQYTLWLDSTSITEYVPTIADVTLELSYGFAKERPLFGYILRSLCFSVCSESSCERLFSKVRLICGKRRYNLSLATLNAALSIVFGESRRKRHAGVHDRLVSSIQRNYF